MKNFIKSFNAGLIAGDEQLVFLPRGQRIGGFIGATVGALAIIGLIGLASRGIWWPVIWAAAGRGLFQIYRQWVISNIFKSDEEIQDMYCTGCGVIDDDHTEDGPEGMGD